MKMQIGGNGTKVCRFVVHATFMFKQRGKLLGLFISGSRHWSVWLHVKSERFPFFPFPFFPGPGVFPFFPFPFIPFPFFSVSFFPFPFFPTPKSYTVAAVNDHIIWFSTSTCEGYLNPQALHVSVKIEAQYEG